MKIIELARNKKTIIDAAIDLDLQYSTDIWLTEQI